jgi:hypothetical protein
MSSETEDIHSIKTGVQISSEILIPGGSNLIKGDFQQAGIHAGLSFIARILFGLPGAVVVSANSISKAMTGRHLHEHLTDLTGTQAQSSPAAPSRPVAETPSPQTPTPRSAAPDGVTLTSSKRPLPAKKPRAKSAKKRPKTSESRSKT